jgi:hypothetical protein
MIVPMKTILLPLVSLCLMTLLTGCGGQESSRAAASPAGNPLVLKLNLPEGAEKNMSMKVDMDMNIDSSMKMQMDMQMDMGFRVLEVLENDHHVMEVQFERIAMSMDNGGGMSIDFDSADPQSAAGPVGQQMAPLIGITFTMTMKPTGEVVEIGGLEDAPPALRQQLEQSQQNMSMMSNFPKEPVDHGDTWEMEMTQNQNGTRMKTLAEYTFLDRKDGEAILGVRGTVSGELNGDITGEIRMDIETGWVTSGELKMEAKGSSGGTDIELRSTTVFSGE